MMRWNGWRVGYFTRELCFYLSFDLRELTRSEPAPRLVSTWIAEQAIRMNAGTSDYRSQRLLKELYLAVTHRYDLPSLAPRDLEAQMLSEVLKAVRLGQLVAVEVEQTAPPTVREVKAKTPPPPTNGPSAWCTARGERSSNT